MYSYLCALGQQCLDGVCICGSGDWTFWSSRQFICPVCVLFFLLVSLRHGFFFETLPRKPASRSHLFTVNIEIGVLRVIFNEAAS